MVAILGNAVLVALGTHQRSARLIHRFGEPCWIADETLVLRAHGVFIPTTGVPAIISITHKLGQLSGCIIRTRILLSIAGVVNTHIPIARREKTYVIGVIAFHVVNDVKPVAVTGSIVATGAVVRRRPVI